MKRLGGEVNGKTEKATLLLLVAPTLLFIEAFLTVDTITLL